MELWSFSMDLGRFPWIWGRFPRNFGAVFPGISGPFSQEFRGHFPRNSRPVFPGIFALKFPHLGLFPSGIPQFPTPIPNLSLFQPFPGIFPMDSPGFSHFLAIPDPGKEAEKGGKVRDRLSRSQLSSGQNSHFFPLIPDFPWNSQPPPPPQQGIPVFSLDGF